MIKITHILWSKKAIGVALNKLSEGENEIAITVKDKNGNFLYPDTITATKQRLLNYYEVENINKKGLMGVFIPLADIERGLFNA
jgi:hypothetical protein